jgi:hypothetical protein
LNSAILDSGEGVCGELLLTLKLFGIFYELDNYPVFDAGMLRGVNAIIGVRWKSLLEWVVTHVVLWMAAVLGRIVGFKAQELEYTPIALMRKER